MAFTDEDPIEHDMGVRVEDMDPQQLVTYIKTYQDAYGRHLVVEGIKERAVIKGMKKLYGDKTAGQIIKWVFYKHKGIWRGDVVTHLAFSKGRKWWVDLVYVEMQEYLRKREVTHVGPREAVGSKRLSDL